MKKILFIANKYPNKIEKNALVFVQQLVWEFAKNDIDCTIICPLAINLNPKYINVPYYIKEVTDNNKKINVYFPKFFGLGQSHYIFGKSPVSITTYFFTKSILKVIKKNKLQFDYVYGHFVAPAGVAAARIGNLLNIPSYFAHGESTSWSIDQFGSKKLENEFKNISGVIAVSTRNKKLVVSKGIVEESKISVFPNGYRKERFYKIDKLEARKHFGWDNKKFIVGFCGSFDDRKGILRLEKAVDIINNKDIVFVCAGKGKLNPTSKKCIFSKPVNNDELNYFYNAIDIFCLPTQNEGCCNAIVEAMACGCPIISSNKDFNYDILDKKNAILINPDNIEEIKNAILELYNNEKIKIKMAQESLVKSKDLTLENRAKKIIEFIK